MDDLPALAKAFRRVEASLGEDFSFSSLKEEDLAKRIEDEQIAILKESKRIYGAICFSHSFSSYLSSNEEEELLDAIDYQGEDIAIIDSIFVDPSFQRKGYGRWLWKHLNGIYLYSTYVAFANEESVGFFASLGFQNSGSKGKNIIMVKPYGRIGLCSKAWF